MKYLTPKEVNKRRSLGQKKRWERKRNEIAAELEAQELSQEVAKGLREENNKKNYTLIVSRMIQERDACLDRLQQIQECLDTLERFSQ